MTQPKKSLARSIRAACAKLLRPAPRPAPAPPELLSAPVEAPAPAALPIAIALQGGGAHGAFSWGVLDCLLEHPELRIAAISGASAGAMNAVIAAYGLTQGGRVGARGLLEVFWRRVSEAGRLTPFRRSWMDRLGGGWGLDRSPWPAVLDAARQFISPYQSNPFGINPLQDILEKLVDFQALRNQTEIQIHISAVNVHTGRGNVFSTPELDAQRVMASACLPSMFQAVEIDGIPYWDGGFASNPPLLPLARSEQARDLLIVPINPDFRRETPRNARDIANRMNEITFNAGLLRNLAEMAQINALIDQGRMDESHVRRMRLHRIDADDEFRTLNASSKVNTEWEFLTHLRDLGRNAAQHWLDENSSKLGVCDTAAPPPPDWLPPIVPAP